MELSILKVLYCHVPFVKMDIFMLQLRQSIPVDFSVKCQVDQEDLMIMDEESYHQILSLQRDREAISSAMEKCIQMKKAMLGLKKLTFLV